MRGMDVRVPLPPQYREFRLARLFGWTPEQIENAPAVWCDWALQFAAIEDQPSRVPVDG